MTKLAYVTTCGPTSRCTHTAPLRYWCSTLEELQGLALGLGPHCCAGLCECYAANYEGWGGGLADLLLWRPLQPSPAAGAPRVTASDCKGNVFDCARCGDAGYEVALVEVKGPNDSLSCRQHAWLDRLVRWGQGDADARLRVGVCYVADTGHGAG